MILYCNKTLYNPNKKQGKYQFSTLIQLKNKAERSNYFTYRIRSYFYLWFSLLVRYLGRVRETILVDYFLFCFPSPPFPPLTVLSKSYNRRIPIQYLICIKIVS
jgi:hypothetical protein